MISSHINFFDFERVSSTFHKTSSHISKSNSAAEVAAQDFLLLQQERNIINDICETEETKKSQILRWAEILEKRIELGTLEIEINQISTYIKRELKVRGWTDGQLAYLGEFMPVQYINENKARYQQQGCEGTLANNEDSIFTEYEKLTQEIQTDNDLDKLSIAELIEKRQRTTDFGKEIKNRISHLNNLVDNYCIREGIRIPELEKESEDKAPENFHGQSVLYRTVNDMSNRFYRIGKRFERIAQLVYEFKPSEEIASKAASKLETYQKKVGEPFEKMCILYTRGLEDILIPVDDSKFGASAGDWMKIGFDKYDSYGSHGSGKVNAVSTGIHAMRLGKDQNSVDITPVKREFTREIVGDRAAKDLLQKAKNYLGLQEVEQFIQIWSKNTTFEEIVQDPEDFFKKEKKRIEQELIMKGGNKTQ